LLRAGFKILDEGTDRRRGGGDQRRLTPNKPLILCSRRDVAGDGTSVQITIREQITLHVVIGDVHAIGTFINKDCDWGVRSGIGNVLDHFFHIERIAHQKSQALRSLESGFAAQNRAQVEFREEHKTCGAEASLHNVLQIREGIYSPRRIEKFDHVRLPDRRPEHGHNGV
jgi:hypothetical protein